MKYFFAVALAAFIALNASAQYVSVSGPVTTSLMTNSVTVPFLAAGSGFTNLPSTQQVPLVIGATGFGVTVNAAGTNSASTTNMLVTLEVCGDSIGNWAANNLLTISVPLGGTGFAPFYTNFVSTTPNVGNATFVRVKSIQNTNLASVFITNLNATMR